jgi:rhamnulokinase
VGVGIHCLALDFGASSVRLADIALDGDRLDMHEISRTAHGPQKIGGHLVWDYPAIYGSIERSLAAAGETGKPFASIGADSWGVDYILLDEAGRRIGQPVSYRDPRTDGQVEAFTTRHVRASRLFEKTGLPALAFNTLFQLYAQSASEPELLARADRLLFTADYAHFWLGGVPATERTLASTSQMLNLDGTWWDEILAPLAIKRSALGTPVQAGTMLGELSLRLQERCALSALKVIAPCTHDTQSAILAVPDAGGGDWAYLSSGTWSILGVESPVPYCDPKAAAAGLGNEQGYGGTFCVQSTVTGLWLIQEIQRLLGYAEAGILTDEAAASEAFRSLINPAAVRFFHPDNMVAEIRAACHEAGEPVPESPGALARCAYDSLALLYRQRLDVLCAITHRCISRLHVLGGGSQVTLLNRICATVTGIPVLAGPAEATAIGNGLAQLIALGAVPGVAEARRLVARSFPPVVVEPEQHAALDDAIARFDHIATLQ